MDTPRTGKTKKKVGKVIKFPLHKVRKPKTDLATQQSKEKAKAKHENNLARAKEFAEKQKNTED